MAFTDEEIAEYGASAAAFCERRVPLHVQDQFWMGFRIEDQSITLIEFRVHWKDKSKVMMRPIAKTKFVRTTGEWRIYWLRADLKWHGYAPCPTVEFFKEFLDAVDRDECCCFFG